MHDFFLQPTSFSCHHCAIKSGAIFAFVELNSMFSIFFNISCSRCVSFSSQDLLTQMMIPSKNECHLIDYSQIRCLVD